MLFFAIKNDDPKWRIRRSFAIMSMRVIVLSVFWILGLMTYVIHTGKEVPNLAPFTTALSFILPALVALIGKYMHDASYAAGGKDESS